MATTRVLHNPIAKAFQLVSHVLESRSRLAFAEYQAEVLGAAWAFRDVLAAYNRTAKLALMRPGMLERRPIALTADMRHALKLIELAEAGSRLRLISGRHAPVVADDLVEVGIA